MSSFKAEHPLGTSYYVFRAGVDCVSWVVWVAAWGRGGMCSSVCVPAGLCVARMGARFVGWGHKTGIGLCASPSPGQ